jgi:hypothetical protein
MYVDAVANSDVFYLQHDFYNTNFKIKKNKLYIPSAPLLLRKKKFWMRTCNHESCAHGLFMYSFVKLGACRAILC